MRRGKWATGFLGMLLLVAVLADVIAGNRPVVARQDSRTCFPALTRQGELVDWKSQAYEWAVWPLIPLRGGGRPICLIPGFPRR